MKNKFIRFVARPNGKPSVVAPDGSLYVAHSPLRRAAGKVIYPDLTPAKLDGAILEMAAACEMFD